MHCQKCGAELEGNEKFCGNCGHPVNAEQKVPEQEVSEQKASGYKVPEHKVPVQEKKKKNGNKKMVFIIPVAVLLLAAGAFTVMNTMGDHETLDAIPKKEETKSVVQSVDKSAVTGPEIRIESVVTPYVPEPEKTRKESVSETVFETAYEETEQMESAIEESQNNESENEEEEIIESETENNLVESQTAENAVPAERIMYVVNCNEFITLRQGPDTKQAEITKMPLGEMVTFEEIAENGFYKVNYRGNTGYALASYLSENQPESTETEQALTEYKTMRVVNCIESITLRTSPSTKASEICQIPLHGVVSYVEEAQDGFYKVIYNGKTGYALSSYLIYTE